MTHGHFMNMNAPFVTCYIRSDSNGTVLDYACMGRGLMRIYDGPKDGNLTIWALKFRERSHKDKEIVPSLPVPFMR